MEAGTENKKGLIVLAFPWPGFGDGFAVKTESFAALQPEGRLLVATDSPEIANSQNFEVCGVSDLGCPGSWKDLARVFEYRADHCVVIAHTFPTVKAAHDAGCYALWARGKPAEDMLETCFQYTGKNLLGPLRPLAEVVRELVFIMPEPDEPGTLETPDRSPRLRIQ